MKAKPVTQSEPVKQRYSLLTKKTLSKGLILGLACASLAACGRDELILPGERLDIRANLKAPVEAAQTDFEARAFSAGAEVNHSKWTHAHGTATHRIKHPSFGTAPSLLWSAKIGTGNSRKNRITADPIVANGKIFTLDATAGVAAHSTSGAALWSVDLTPSTDKNTDASGGGLAIDGDRLFVTTGFGELVALNPNTGARLWTQDLDAAATGAPTVVGGLVYLVSSDNRAWAIDVTNGRVKWEIAGAPSAAGFISGAGPVVNDQLAIFPFASGELVGVFRKGGVRLWNASVAGTRRGRAYTGVTDISGAPVIDNATLYAGNQSGRVVALDVGTGNRLWTAREGAYGTIWPAGDSIFFVSDIGQLVRLDAQTGETIWVRDLPHFVKSKTVRRKAVFAHFGPVLAGGRLLIASDDKKLRAFSPEDGALLGETEMPAGATTNPVIVDRTLYVVSEKGQLHAFR